MTVRATGRGRTARRCWVVVALVVVAQVLAADGLVAQARSSSGGAVVTVPPVASLAVESVGAEAVRIRVRANHDWQVVVAAPAESGILWVRAGSARGAGEYRRIEPGTELAVAGGSRGETVIHVEYRWSDGAVASRPGGSLLYTLASR